MVNGTSLTSSSARFCTPNLSLEKHVTSLSAKCFFQLRQLRRIRRSLDDDSIAALVHAFVATRVDSCIGLLAGTAKKTTDKLQRVFNAAARVMEPRKYDRVWPTQFRRRTPVYKEDRIQNVDPAGRTSGFGYNTEKFLCWLCCTIITLDIMNSV